jgi:acyl transferase domain-containing protein
LSKKPRVDWPVPKNEFRTSEERPTLFAMHVALEASMRAYGVRPARQEFLHHNAALSI